MSRVALCVYFIVTKHYGIQSVTVMVMMYDVGGPQAATMNVLGYVMDSLMRTLTR